jgi:hypothetical protein
MSQYLRALSPLPFGCTRSCWILQLETIPPAPETFQQTLHLQHADNNTVGLRLYPLSQPFHAIFRFHSSMLRLRPASSASYHQSMELTPSTQPSSILSQPSRGSWIQSDIFESGRALASLGQPSSLAPFLTGHSSILV